MADQTLRFAAFELDFARRELRREGKLVELQPTPLRVLLYLAEHRDRTVPKTELVDAVWPDSVVGDTSLSVALAHAREACGDDGDAQRVIRTYKGAGYRFVAEASVVLGDALALSAAAAQAKQRRSRRRALAAAGLLALGAIGAATWPRQEPTAAAEHVPFGVAVLPIANFTGDPHDQALADGLTEQITTALSESGYPVVARTTASLYRDRAADVRELATSLGVSHVLEGSLRRVGEKLRVTTQLIPTDSGMHVWAETFEHAAGDPFEVQDRVADRAVFAVFRFVVEDAVALKRDPELAKVSELMMEARHLFIEVRYEEALAAYERMLAIAPQREPFVRLRADALAGASRSWAQLFLWGSTPFGEAGPKMLALAEEAVALAPDSSNCRHALLRAHLHHWSWEAAEREAKRACEIAPGSADCGIATVQACAALGCVESQLEGARLYAAQAPMDPSGTGTLLAEALINNDLFEEAEAVSRRAWEIDPRLAQFLPTLQWRLGRRSEAVASMSRLLAAAGWPEAARELPQRGEASPRATWRWIAEQFAAGKYSLPNQSELRAAVLFAQLGEMEPALDALERSVAEHGAGMERRAVDPVFDPIRDTPRFRALTDQMGLTPYHEKYGVFERARQRVAAQREAAGP